MAVSYVVGFAFSLDKSKVLLIEKQNFPLHRGLWNGLGGKRNPSETSPQAMSREFEEECGLSIPPEDWVWIDLEVGAGYLLDVFIAQCGDLSAAATRTNETVRVFTLPEALALPLVPGVNAILSKYGSTDGSKPSTGKNMNEVTLSGRGDSPANLAEMVFFQQAVHKTAVDHGWWETGKGDTFGEKLSLMHSELSEALEAYRETGSVTKIWENPDKPGKLEGVPVELADCIIRIFDFMGHHGVDMEAVLLAKHRYNESRPYRHGGKTI